MDVSQKKVNEVRRIIPWLSIPVLLSTCMVPAKISTRPTPLNFLTPSPPLNASCTESTLAMRGKLNVMALPGHTGNSAPDLVWTIPI
jgi:hypothetical protein